MQIQDMFWVRLSELHKSHANSSSYKNLFDDFGQRLICPDFDSISSFENNNLVHFASHLNNERYRWIDGYSPRNRWNVDLSVLSKWYLVVSSRIISSLDKKHLDGFKTSERLTDNQILNSGHKFIVPNSY